MPREVQLYNTLSGITGGVWRDGDVIVKQLRRSADALPWWTPSAEPTDALYWRREADVYESGLPARLGLGAPQLLRSTTTSDGVQLELTALAGRTAATITVKDLQRLATILGRSQGRSDLPAEPWLSRGFLRFWSTSGRTDHSAMGDESLWSRRYAAPFVTDEIRADILAMHANRFRLLAIAESLPRTICHLDLFPNNVFATDDSVSLIDWSFTGDGAIGEDIGNLIPDSIFDLGLPVSVLPELEETLPAHYIAGLRESGWSGDDRLVRLAIHASAIKYDWFAPRLLQNADNDEQKGYGGAVVDIMELSAARWTGLALLGRWAREAVAEAERLRL